MLEFMKNGLLPPGDHEIMRLEKVISEGPGNGQTWDIPGACNCCRSLKALSTIACSWDNEVYIDVLMPPTNFTLMIWTYIL